MSTRSIILVTGASQYSGTETYQLYKHSDGYPTGNLEIIADAIKKCAGLIKANADKWGNSKESKPWGPSMLTGAIIGEATSIYGMGAFVEETYGEKLAPKHLGVQCDLEWIYIIDVNQKTVKIYGGGYTGNAPQAAYKKGPVNPEIHCQNLKDEYQADELKEIKELVARIEKLGFAVNPKKKTKKSLK